MKIYTQEALNEIIEKHQRWLDEDEGGKRADLSYANLRYADLSEANLSYANLRYADLSYANLRYADLSYANLSEANLSYANLSEANLSGANLSGANLSYADLSYANLSYANLSYANLSEANLSEANLSTIKSLWSTTGNGKEIKTTQTDIWVVTYTKTYMQIGCQKHKIKDWWNFTDAQISNMEAQALAWWQKWKPILKQIIEASSAD